MDTLNRVERKLNALGRADKPVLARARAALHLVRHMRRQVATLTNLAFASYRKGDLGQYKRFARAAYDLQLGVERVRSVAASWFKDHKEPLGFPRIPQPSANWSELAPEMPWRPEKKESAPDVR